jgi:GGDEF domain-containing protein
MASREVSGRARAGIRLAAAVLGSAAIAGLLEGLTVAAGWPLIYVLTAGVVLAVPLTFLLGGWRLVCGYTQALRDLAVDDLTGVRSRRAFGSDLPAAVDTATRGGRPLTLALVELTNVTGAVDLFGRRRAEALIREAAASLDPVSSALPATYRLAAELFAVVLDGVGPDAAFEVTDGLLDRLSRHAAPLSAVGGLATLDARCSDAELLLVGASAALDEARALGAGRVAASADPGSGLRWVATPGPR